MSYDARCLHHTTAGNYCLAPLTSYETQIAKHNPQWNRRICKSSAAKYFQHDHQHVFEFWNTRERQLYCCIPLHFRISQLLHYLSLHSIHMHYIITVAITTLAAVGVSALPLRDRGLVTADSITHSADDLVKRNNDALPVTHDKYCGRRILSSRAAEGSVVPESVHVLGPFSKFVKRIAQDLDPFIDFDIAALPVLVGGKNAGDCLPGECQKKDDSLLFR